MSLRYTKIRKNPKTFQRLFGITPQEFEIIVKKAEPKWHERVISGYKRPGRDYKLDLSDMILMLFLYYGNYVTQIFVGYMFGIDDSRVCRIIQRLEPILASVMAMSKCKKLSKEEVENLIIDATEQSIERPKKRQKPYYSGKKKRHTLKTEIRTTLAGKIVHVSKSYPGSTHDFTVFKGEKRPAKDTRVFVEPIRASRTFIQTLISLINPQKTSPSMWKKKSIIVLFQSCVLRSKTFWRRSKLSKSWRIAIATNVGVTASNLTLSLVSSISKMGLHSSHGKWRIATKIRDSTYAAGLLFRKRIKKI